MFHAEYSSGQPVSMLVDLRAVVDAALAKNAKNPKSAPTTKPAAATKTRAQAASAAGNSDVPDFEVTSSSPDWSETSPTGEQGIDDSKPK
jgi:hypothetical protein